MQRKIHNKTLFVAALSVYLGLLIVGAPPHILAQQIEAQTKQAESEVKLNRKPFDDFAKRFKEEIQSGKINLDHSCSISVKATLDNDGKLSNARVINKTGDTALCESAIGFVSALSDSGTLIYLSNLTSPQASDITITLNAENGDFSLTNTVSVGTPQRANKIASGLNLLLQIAKQQRQINSVSQELLRSATVNAKDSDFMVITHLPRAALDSLLRADEKAN